MQIPDERLNETTGSATLSEPIRATGAVTTAGTLTSTAPITSTAFTTPTVPIVPRASRSGLIYYVPFAILNLPTAPPIANFGVDRSSGYAPLTVQFQNLSIDARASAWDVGDGTTSTAREPSHVYQESGTYSVTLTVSNTLGTDSGIPDNNIRV